MYDDWRPYVPVARRRAEAARKLAKLKKKGQTVSPVLIRGRTIATSFWGKAWCNNLEAYSDYANRLPRGRTYVRNGSVVDLQIEAGVVTAAVSGSDLYAVRLEITALPKARWTAIRKDCAGAIASLVELLQGRFSQGVMARLCQQKTGLFPSPSEIKLSCSCPDWALMCKHVAAVLYGVGARLDEAPELLFRLRDVDEQELLSGLAADLPMAKAGKPKAGSKVIADADLSELFGLNMATDEGAEMEKKPVRGRAKVARKKVAVKKPTTKKVAAKKTAAKKALVKKPPARKPAKRTVRPG